MPFRPISQPAHRPPPHPATLAQSKHAFEGLVQYPPHAATVAQPRTLPVPIGRSQPHAATLPLGQERTTVQCMKKEEAYPASFAQLLKQMSGGHMKPKILIISMAMDEKDHGELFEMSVGAYRDKMSCGTVLNDKEIVYDATNGVSGDLVKIAQPLILVVTTHGNLQWLFGEKPGNEEVAGSKFCEHLQSWLKIPLQGRFAAIVLDACWSGSEPKLDDYKINVECCARTFSRLATNAGVNVIGFDGKTANNLAITYYSAPDLTKERMVPYQQAALVFRNGNLILNTGAKEKHYHSTKLLGNEFYKKFGDLGKSFETAVVR